jgi:hypothetical protein
MISEKEARWIKRMQKTGLFPTTPELEPAPALRKGAWRLTSQPDGAMLVEVNDVPVPIEIALEIARIIMAQETLI